MNVLFVASECAPFIKTGGLADVIGAVPKALGGLGAEVRVLIPAYPALAAQVAAGKTVAAFPDLFGDAARVVAFQAEGIALLLLDAPHLFNRPGGIYIGPDGQDWPDNHLRFAALSWVGAHLAQNGVDGWQADVVNAHDWQAGLVAAYLKQAGTSAPPVVSTVHNIAFQGLFPASTLASLKLAPSLFTSEAVEFFGYVGFLKAALALSDKITTVSPSYASELALPEFGMGLEGVLHARAADLTGILNGIDLDTWNPETDAYLPQTYSLRAMKGKAASRAAVEHRFALAPGDGPIFCVISRLTWQKGLDMLIECLPALVDGGGRLALLGTGEKAMEQAFVSAAAQYPGAVGVVIGYDEALSHVLQAGSDAILIPSRFEPCGLTQLYGLRYGTLPIVARTGGLADTVIDANVAANLAGCATGFQFAPINATMLSQTIARATEMFRSPKNWTAMMRRAMKHPVGWGTSAQAYVAVYQAAIDRRKGQSI